MGKMRMGLWLLLAGAVFPAIGAAPVHYAWKTYTFPEAGLSLQSPVPLAPAPVEEGDLKASGFLLEKHYASARNNATFFIDVYARKGVQNRTPADLKKSEKACADQMLAQFPKLRYNSVRSTFKGLPALLIAGTFDIDGKPMRVRYLDVAQGPWLWTVMVLYPVLPSNEKGAKGVIHSVKVGAPKP